MKSKPVFEAPEKTSAFAESLNSLLPIFSALAAILAVRLFLLFAIIGAFILAQASLADTTYHSLWVVVAYSVLTVLPLVYLDIQGKKRP